VVFIYCLVDTYNPNYIIMNIWFNILLPRIIYSLSIFGFLLTFTSNNKKRFKTMMRILSVFPTLILLLNDSQYLLIIIMLIFTNMLTQIVKTLDLSKHPLFMIITAIISSLFFFRTGHRTKLS